MKNVLSVILMVFGILIILFGGFGITIYFLYDIVSNWDVLTKLQVFWDLVLILFRDMFTVSIGAILILIGKAISD